MQGVRAKIFSDNYQFLSYVCILLYFDSTLLSHYLCFVEIGYHLLANHNHTVLKKKLHVCAYHIIITAVSVQGSYTPVQGSYIPEV